MTDGVEAAWEALYDSLPPRWHVNRPSHDPGRHTWSVTAWGPPRGRDTAPQSVTGTGADECAALWDLDRRLRAAPRSQRTRREDVRRRLMLAYIEGAEATSREQSGRGLTGDELERLLVNFDPRT